MLVCALLLIPGAVAAQTKREDNVDQAVTILERFRDIPEQAIPAAVMLDAKGLAIRSRRRMERPLGHRYRRRRLRLPGRRGGDGIRDDVGVAAGPVGRTASAAVTPVAAVYSYSRSQGLFAGVSVTGTVIATRDGATRSTTA